MNEGKRENSVSTQPSSAPMSADAAAATPNIEIGRALLKGVEESTGIRLKWNLTVEQIDGLSDAIIEKSKELLDKVAASKAEPTTANVLDRLLEEDIITRVAGNMCDFPSSVAVDKAIRDASTAADKKLSAYSVQSAMRVDVYEAIQAYAESDEGKALVGEHKRYLERTLRDCKRLGLHLDAESREKISAKKQRMSELGIQFSNNLNEEKTTLLFDKAALDGMSDDFLSSLEKDGEKYVCNLKYPCYFPLMQTCVVEETRKQMETAYNSRCLYENTKILEELIELRQQVADILGYPTHAAYITEMRMSKTPDAVMKFLKDMSDKTTALMAKEMEVCLELKKAEKAARVEPFNGKIHAWDVRHYLHLVEKQQYSVDHDAIKEYFPLDVVLSGMLDIYQELLGLRFEKVEDAEVWQEDVQMFAVFDVDTGNKIGWFYLDMHPREGKYGHAACFGLQPGCQLANGTRQLPIAACVCNFTKPLPSKPSLLLHEEVTTFFHEFGHVMHQICTEAITARFAGTAVERDFVEAPSQMLENWTWEAEGLERMSGHFEDHSKKLPAELREPLVASRMANTGILEKRQLVLGTFDQRIHTCASANTAQVLAETTKEIWTGIAMTPGTNMAASFGHIAGGYDAQYYGYMWSEVFSADMFESRFKKAGIFDAATGRDYRKFILAPGGSRDAADMLRDFLGRDPTPDAFLRSKGLAI